MTTMKHRVIIYCEDDEAARFQYSIDAHQALVALTKFDTRRWCLVDTRFTDDVIRIFYQNGKWWGDKV